MVLNEDYMLHIENMKQILKIETFYVKPPVNTDEILEDLDWCRRSEAPVKANLTDWNISDYFPDLCSQLNVLYPSYKIEDLWVASYGLGDYTESHDHRGFDWSFVWYLDASIHCPPLCFPDLKHPWLPPHVIYPKVGNLHVFDGGLVHYVPPHTCNYLDRTVVSGNLIHREGLKNDDGS